MNLPTLDRALVRGLRFCAVAVALHGGLLLLCFVVQSRFPDGFLSSATDLIEEIGFFALTVPALILTRPFVPILWNFGLMSAPGWFAWPKPPGIALAYIIWIVGFLLLAQEVQRLGLKK